MKRHIGLAGSAALGLALALSGAAEAQTAHRHHARHHMAVVAADPGGPGAATNGAGRAAGRQIIVRPGPSYLTAGTGAFPGEFSGYASWTVTPLNHVPSAYTFTGIRGLDRLPNNFTVPGCCVP
ncbi:MAG TPA: hypothetical protein VMI72_00860 [Roseiarcus sp.]|nr:hypothetical protein [Roseiarcus sp.]